MTAKSTARVGSKILGLLVPVFLSQAAVVQGASPQPTPQTPKAVMETLIRAARTLDAHLWAKCLSSADRPYFETMASESFLRHLAEQKKGYEARLGHAIGEDVWEFASLITVVDVTGGSGLPDEVVAMTHIPEETIWDERYAEVTVILPLEVKGYLPPMRFHFVKENGEWKFCQWLTTRLMLGWDRSKAGNPNATINLLLKAHGVEIDRGQCANLRRNTFPVPETVSVAYRTAIEKASPSARGQLLLLWATAGEKEAERLLAEEDARNPQAGLLKMRDQYLKFAAALNPCTPPPAETTAKSLPLDSPEFWLRTFDQDIQGLRMLLARFPEEKTWCLKARLRIASLQLRSEVYQKAADEFAKAIELYPEPSDDLVEAKGQLARLYWNNLDRKPDAIRLWRELESIGRLPQDAVLGERPLEITRVLWDSASGWMTGIMDFDLSADGGLVLLRLVPDRLEQQGQGKGPTVSRLDLHDASGTFLKTLVHEETTTVSGAMNEIFLKLQRAGDSYYVRVNGGNGKMLIFDTSGGFQGQLRRRGQRFLKEGARSVASIYDDGSERQELMPRAFSVGADSFAILTLEQVRFFDQDGNLLRESALPHAGYGDNTKPVMTQNRTGDVIFTQPLPGKVFRLDRTGGLTPMRNPGTVEGSFSRISHLFTDANRNIYVVDPPSRKVLKFDRAGTFVRSFSHESVTGPTSATVDEQGTVYIVGYGFNGGTSVARFDSGGRYLDTVSIPSGQGQVPYGNIVDVEVSRGEIYAIVGSSVIRCDPKGAFLSMFKSSDRNGIGALTKDNEGQIYFTTGGKIYRYAGGESQPLALPPDEDPSRGFPPRGGGFLLAGFDRGGAMIGVAANWDPVRLEPGATAFQRIQRVPGRSVFSGRMAADADGRLLFVDSNDRKVLAIAMDGTESVMLQAAANTRQSWHPQDVVVDGQDNIYVYDGTNGSLLKFKPDGSFVGECSLRTQVPGWVQRIRLDEKDRLYLLVDDSAKDSKYIARLALHPMFESGEHE